MLHKRCHIKLNCPNLFIFNYLLLSTAPTASKTECNFTHTSQPAVIFSAQCAHSKSQSTTSTLTSNYSPAYSRLESNFGFFVKQVSQISSRSEPLCWFPQGAPCLTISPSGGLILTHISG